MAKLTKSQLTAIIVAVPLVLSAGALTLLRAPGATVEGYGEPIGISGEEPGEQFASALAEFPVSIGEQEFTAGELGVSPMELPSIPRAWSFGDWGRDFPVELQVDENRRNQLLAEIEGYGAPVEAAVSFDGNSWVASESAPGRELSRDLPEAIAEAMDSGEKSVSLELQEFAPTVSTETAQEAADKLNGASLAIYGGSTEIAKLSGGELAALIALEPADGALKVVPNQDAVNSLAADYSANSSRSRMDGEQIVGDDGSVLRTLAESRDGFSPGSQEEIASYLTGELQGILEQPEARLELPGKVDAAKPLTRNRSAVVDLSDHYAYFYENGEEVARHPVAVGKPGFESDTGTFKVYAQLAKQNMGSCDSRGNLIPGGAFDYCVVDVPWISYYNGDEGLHGVYWHNNFGNPNSNLSHGCVNLDQGAAEWAYRFLEVGSTVTVRD